MMLAYWDESGDAHDPNVQYVCVAGVIADARCWRAFYAEWQR